MGIEVRASQRFDSRGKPTVQATVKVGEAFGSALVPSGASTGKREAVELRDHKRAYLGFGVEDAIGNILEKIAPAIADIDITDQTRVDNTMIELDGTKDKSNLGANAMLAVSLAVARAAAEVRGKPLYRHIADLHGTVGPLRLPTPMFNIVNGGAHAHNGLDFQEFMIAPDGETFSEKMRVASEVYGTLGEMLRRTDKVSGVGDEGGYSPTSFFTEIGTERVEETMELLKRAISQAGHTGGRVSIALDPASSGFFKEGKYYMAGGQELSPESMVEFCEHLAANFFLFSVEDFVAEDDDLGWKLLTKRLGDRLQLVGDDRFVTNPEIFKEAIAEGIGNAILVKPNQIGTLTETLGVITIAQAVNYGVIISHRSGETEDTFIADLAVATNAGQIKTGAPARGERTAKYNRLLDIEEELAI